MTYQKYLHNIILLGLLLRVVRGVFNGVIWRSDIHLTFILKKKMYN